MPRNKPQKGEMSELRKWYELSDYVEHIAARFAFLRIPDDENDVSRVHRIGFALVARSASAFKGVLILAHAKRVVEARIVARSCVENALYLNALIKDGEELVGLIEKSDVRSRGIRGQFMLDQPRIIFDDTLRSELKEFLKRNQLTGPSEPPRVCRRLISSNQAAILGCSDMV
jgi:hypothetical protein